MENLSEEYGSKILALLKSKQEEIQKALYELIITVAAVAATTSLKPGKFSLSRYPRLNAFVDKAIGKLRGDLHASIINGIDGAWTISDAKNKVFVDQALKGLELSPNAKKIYYDSHVSVKEAFQKENINGLNLSDRVWNVAEGARKEIELGIHQGIATGESAREMAKRMQKYLKVPDNTFRDVEDETLRKQLKVEAAKNGAPGVYRSSYKNALRLARDQVNRSYRTADYERWQSQPFVVGIEISLSNNHPLKPEHEMCEQLAGKYPKDFFWRGNHVSCLCHATPILITKEEMNKYTTEIIEGKDANISSANEVTDVPGGFKSWYTENKDEFARLKSIPDLVKANPKYIPQGA